MHKYCFTCKYENLSAESAPCKGCFDGSESKWFPKTQADRIRSMSDEELAELLYETETQYLPIGLHVKNYWLARLRQEVE